MFCDLFLVSSPFLTTTSPFNSIKPLPSLLNSPLERLISLLSSSGECTGLGDHLCSPLCLSGTPYSSPSISFSPQSRLCPLAVGLVASQVGLLWCVLRCGVSVWCCGVSVWRCGVVRSCSKPVCCCGVSVCCGML